MTPQYKLYYFNGMWLAEPVRYMFAYKGVEYEDFRFEREEWANIKPTMPWGQVPVLEVNGEKLSQSTTIYRYVAKKLGLQGDTEMEIAKCDEYINVIVTDARQACMKFYQEQDEKKKEELKKTLLEETLPVYFKKYVEVLQTNGTGFLVGKKLTYADIIIAHNLERIAEFLKEPGMLDKTPELKKHQQTVFSQPGIKEWIAKRPKTAF